jgi:hypothetical protein
MAQKQGRYTTARGRVSGANIRIREILHPDAKRVGIQDDKDAWDMESAYWVIGFARCMVMPVHNFYWCLLFVSRQVQPADEESKNPALKGRHHTARGRVSGTNSAPGLEVETTSTPRQGICLWLCEHSRDY